MSDLSGPIQDPPHPKVSKTKMVLFLGGLLLMPFLLVTVLWRDRCPTQSVQRIASPNGKMLAEQVTRDCGTRMPQATEVRLLRTEPGKDADTGTVLVLPSTRTLSIVWNDDASVAIKLPDNQSQVVTFREHWQEVRVALIGDVISSVPKILAN